MISKAAVSAITMAVGIILPNILLQCWVEGKIQVENSRKLFLELERSENLQASAFHNASAHFYDMLGVVADGFTGGKKLQMAPILPHHDPEQIRLNEQMERGKLTPRAYIAEMSLVSKKRCEKYADRVKALRLEIEAIRNHPTKAYDAKKFLHLLQYFGVLLLIIISGLPETLFQNSKETNDSKQNGSGWRDPKPVALKTPSRS